MSLRQIFLLQIGILTWASHLAVRITNSFNIHLDPSRCQELCWDPHKAINNVRLLPWESSYSSPGLIAKGYSGGGGAVCSGIYICVP